MKSGLPEELRIKYQIDKNNKTRRSNNGKANAKNNIYGKNASCKKAIFVAEMMKC